MEQDGGEDFIPVGVQAGEASASDSDLRGGVQARARKRTVQRVIRKVLREGYAWWKGRRLVPDVLPRFFHGSAIEAEKEKLRKAREYMAPPQARGAPPEEPVKVQAVDVVTYNAQSLRPPGRLAT
eukprot:15482659-Alexandrium_andersonii.AAC.1